mgnify:CR=1 FL=1
MVAPPNIYPVILDEPFSNVDPIKSEEILTNIFDEVIDKLFLLVTHNMGHAKKCDRIIVLILSSTEN